MILGANSDYAPIFGEFNILRYLYRIGPNELSYERWPLADTIDIDSTLDTCSLVVNSVDTKYHHQFLKQYAAKLGKKDYFGDSLISAEDVAISSAIKQLGKINVPQPLVNWLERLSRETTGIYGYLVLKC